MEERRKNKEKRNKHTPFQMRLLATVSLSLHSALNIHILLQQQRTRAFSPPSCKIYMGRERVKINDKTTSNLLLIIRFFGFAFQRIASLFIIRFILFFCQTFRAGHRHEPEFNCVNIVLVFFWFFFFWFYRPAI
jgi:hypothetical protein